MCVFSALKAPNDAGRITPELVAMLGDKNWKVRGEGLEQVAALLKEAKGRIQPSIGDLATPLYERLDDSNKNLVSITLGLIGMLTCSSLLHCPDVCRHDCRVHG